MSPLGFFASQRPADAKTCTASFKTEKLAKLAKRVGTIPLHIQVAMVLRDGLFQGIPPQGTPLDELEMCVQLGISRTPLREALKLLAAEGLLDHRPRQGTSVSKFSSDDLDGLLMVVGLLHPRCASEAAQRADEAGLAALEATHFGLASRLLWETDADCRSCLHEIHDLIADLSGNQWLAHATKRVNGLLRLATVCRPLERDWMTVEVAHLRAVTDAIRAGDPAKAATGMRLRLEGYQVYLRNSRLRVPAPARPTGPGPAR